MSIFDEILISGITLLQYDKTAQVELKRDQVSGLAPRPRRVPKAVRVYDKVFAGPDTHGVKSIAHMCPHTLTGACN